MDMKNHIHIYYYKGIIILKGYLLLYFSTNSPFPFFSTKERNKFIN
jgi:hypothetical protein